MLKRLALLSACALLCTGCGPRAEPGEPAPADGATGPSAVDSTDQAPSPPPDAGGSAGDPQPEPGDTEPATFEGTAGITDKAASTAGVATLRAVRTARHDAFDRVVFEFEGDALPGYHVEYIDRPVRACGSGDVVDFRGDAWLQVRLAPAQAHTDSGEATIQDRQRRLDHENLLDLKLTCDFEADVTWVLGLGSPNRYRVLELRKPTRLVLDVRH